MVFVLFQTPEDSETPIQIFLPFDRHVPVYVAKQHFQMQFAAQYTIEHAQSIEWHPVSVHDLNNDERVTLSEIDESMSLEDLRQTQNTPDGRDHSSLLVIMTFSSTVLEDPRYQHSQPVSDFHGVRCDFDLYKALPTIARNVIVAIDSSIGPLSQSEFPNYNKRPDEIMPLDTSKFMMKTVESYWNQENLEYPLKDILFRPSWFSLLSHILFNSWNFVRKPIGQRLRPMAHVVTGSSGVGKSVLRFPAITLALSLGAIEVCTAKTDEYPLRFVRKTSENTSRSTPVPPAKKPTMRVAHVNKPPRDVPITPTTYKYEVFISKTKADKVYNHTIFDKEDIARRVEDPNNPGEVKYTHLRGQNSIKLGEVEVPSIHHFPHFLRLFVDRRDQVRNPLEGKTWHIVDDLIMSSDDLKRSHHYIFLTTPNRASWKQVASLVNQSLMSLALYVLPKFTLAEEVNMLNALPHQSDPLTQSRLERLKQIVETDGFTPLSILPDLRQSPTLEERAKEVIASGDVIGQSIHRNLIVLDSPQADPHNFTTTYASPPAEEIVAEKWTTKLAVQHKILDDPAHRCSSAELTDLMIPSLFQRLTNSAVRQGAHFSKMKIRGEVVVREDGKSFSFPPTPTRSGVDSSGTCDTLHAFLPDMALFRCSEENRFDDDMWGRFFVKPMIAKPFKSGPVEEKKGKFVFKKTETQNPLDVGRITPMDSVTPSEEQTTDQHEQPPTQACSPAELHFFTFHLVPHSLYNAGFESILLFFRVDSTNKIDSLGVHFLKSSIGDEAEIDAVGANAMMAWLVLLMDLYELRADQIFPHFVFVVSERVFDRFTPEIGNIKSFIPEDNIVTAALTSPTGNLHDLTIEAEDTLLLDTGKRLQPNNDPMCVRCGFCGEVIGDEFFHHKCWYSRSGWTNLNFPRELLDPKTRHSLFKYQPELRDKMVKLTNVVVSEDDPTFFYTQKTLAEREADRQSGSSDRHADTHPVGLQVKYPFPTMARPNARMSGNHLTFDVVRVTMVSPVEAQRLGRRLLTDSFVSADQATPLSMSVTVNLSQPLPPPCHLYRTPFYQSELAHRAARMIFPPEYSDPSFIEEAEKKADPFFALPLETVIDFDDIEQTSTPPLEYFESSVREREHADEQQSRHRHGQVEPTTLDIADPLDTWNEGEWIELETDGNSIFATAGSYYPHRAHEFDEPSPFLIDSSKCLGQTMLPFESVGELRERIRRSFPAIHPSILRPPPHTATARPQPMIEQCMLVIQHELELFWQVLSLPNMTEPDFDSSFGFSFCGLQMILQKFGLFIKSSVNFQRDLRLFAKLLLYKASDVQARIATIKGGLVSSWDNDILNWCRLAIWRDTHPKMEDGPSASRILQMEDELKALSEWVNKPVCNAAQLKAHQDRLVSYRTSIVQRAWTLFDFFGSLAMSLPASTLTQPQTQIPGQLMDPYSKTGKDADVLKAMQCVSSIIAYVECLSFVRIYQSSTSISKNCEHVKCLETFNRLLEYLPQNFDVTVYNLIKLGLKMKGDVDHRQTVVPAVRGPPMVYEIQRNKIRKEKD
ncbi:hypothetical protein BLNAU_12798 [Blattamonas nauphoetae]|uniref:Uncharacterized protein n=1 Tax=Blattamonas nauphoetae TaxID=2049346 RepID=A0ABQ9XN71_9EUKA|nr:hypothetical protein BLNAU_12798 [Blattamonas nauphoetae]